MALAVGKVIVAVATTGVIGTVGVGSLVYFAETKEQSIEELLASSNPKKTLLTSDNKEKEGLQAWTKYKKDKGYEKKDWTISDWIANGANDKFTEGLIKVCEERKKDKVKKVTDEAYINFVNWCTKEAE